MSFYEEQRDKELIRALNDIVKELREVRSSIDALSAIELKRVRESTEDTSKITANESDIEDSVEAAGWYCKFDHLTWSTVFTCENCGTDTILHGKLDRMPQINCNGCGRPFKQVDREPFL